MKNKEESRGWKTGFSLTLQSLVRAQIWKISSSSAASKNSSQVLCELASAITTFRKYWETNVGWSFKGRLGCGASSAKVQSRFSVSREYIVYISPYNVYPVKVVHVCVPTTSARRDTRSRSRTVPKRRWQPAGVPPTDRKENSTSLLRTEMQSASGRFAHLLDFTEHLFANKAESKWKIRIISYYQN